MTDPALLLVVLTFVLIAVTPRIFFRRDGELNLRWWSLAAPVGVAPVLLVGAELAGLAPHVPQDWLTGTRLAAVVLAAAAIALVSLTLGTHRIPIALWHQSDDAPRHLVTWGAYRRVRHPFYSSYLLAFLAAVAVFPHLVTLALLTYMAVQLNAVAAKEERKLAASEFGAEYTAYTHRTGRFLPRPGSRSAETEPTTADRDTTT